MEGQLLVERTEGSSKQLEVAWLEVEGYGRGLQVSVLTLVLGWDKELSGTVGQLCMKLTNQSIQSDPINMHFTGDNMVCCTGDLRGTGTSVPYGGFIGRASIGLLSSMKGPGRQFSLAGIFGG